MIHLLILLILLYLFFIFGRAEGFTHQKDPDALIRVDDDSLDELYAKLYDDLYDTLPSHRKECETILPYLNANSEVLCLDSRTGHLVQLLSNSTRVSGLDTSSFMVDYARGLYPALTFHKGSYNPYHLRKMTHLVCPLFSIHQKHDIGFFLSVCYNWLIHKGILFISYMPAMDRLREIIQSNPRPLFRENYTFSLEIEPNPGYSIVTEVIHKQHRLKRKNLWNFQSIQLDHLIYETSLKGFKFLKNADLGPFHMAIFSKTT